MRGGSVRIALGGIISAAALAVMILGFALPFSTVAVPAAASFAVFFFVIEFGRGMAAAVYAVISVLSALLAPEKEAVLLFICFLGYYPIVKSAAETLRGKALGWLIKFASLNIAMAATYFIAVKLLAAEAALRELRELTGMLPALLIALANVAFLFYDVALTKLITLYILRLRSRFFKSGPRR